MLAARPIVPSPALLALVFPSSIRYFLPQNPAVLILIKATSLSKTKPPRPTAGPKWNSTLFIITYDEHGGFFDHVPPPQEGVPNPDGILTKGGFNFTRLGVRIPTIAISPWIEQVRPMMHGYAGGLDPGRMACFLLAACCLL